MNHQTQTDMTRPILLVEDDENDVFFFKRAIKQESLGNPLQVARDGREAIDYLSGLDQFADRDQFPLPYLVVLDLKLPFVMGLDVLKWIRQQPHLSPIVVVLSSSQENADIEAAYRLGTNAYLVKSPELGKLQEMIRAITDFWLTNHIPAASLAVADLPYFRGQGLIDTSNLSKRSELYENNHNSTHP